MNGIALAASFLALGVAVVSAYYQRILAEDFRREFAAELTDVKKVAYKAKADVQDQNDCLGLALMAIGDDDEAPRPAKPTRASRN